MKAKRSYIIAGGVLIVLFVTAYATYQYMYKDHRDIASEKVNFEIAPTALSEAMSQTHTSLEYIDKVIQTNGLITAIEQNSVILDDKVQLNFSTDTGNLLNEGSELKIKGRCVGYDDLLELVKIDQATIIK